MKRRMKHFALVGAVAGMMLLAALTIPGPRALSAPGTAPVTVMNLPLPVALQGTGNIAGNVNAAQSGTWNVGVTGLPAVQLAAGTKVGINGGVTLDDPAKQAYSVKLCATDSESCGSIPEAVTVPFGTRYVIEQASGYCVVRNTGIHGWILTGRLGDQDYDHYVGDKISAHDDDSATGLFKDETQIYVDGGLVNGLSVDVMSQNFHEYNDFGPEAYCHITLSGYLVQMPAQFP